MKRFLPRLPEIAIGLLAVSTIARIILVAHDASHTAVWCNTFARLDPIAGGAVLAYSLHGKMPSFSSAQRCALLLFGVAALFCAGVFGDESGLKCLWTYPLVSVACVAMLIAVLGIAHTMPQPLIYLGEISYGLYVYHTLALWIVHERTIPALALTILVSALSYHCLEEPFLRLKERFALVGSRRREPITGTFDDLMMIRGEVKADLGNGLETSLSDAVLVSSPTITADRKRESLFCYLGEAWRGIKTVCGGSILYDAAKLDWFSAKLARPRESM